MTQSRNYTPTLKVKNYSSNLTLIGLIEKEDDETLFAIAEELGKAW
jgi:hypothetical protein